MHAIHLAFGALGVLTMPAWWWAIRTMADEYNEEEE